MDREPTLFKATVPGQPAPAGSKTADPIMRNNPDYDSGRPKGPGNFPKIPVLDEHGRPMVRQRHASKYTEPWMELVVYYAKLAWAGKGPLSGALWIDLACVEKRPDSHFRTGKFSHLLRPDAPAYPSTTATGDSGKLRRAIEDALTTAQVWEDDKRVVWGCDTKEYGDEPQATITVGRMAAQTVEDLGLISPDPPAQPSLLAEATA